MDPDIAERAKSSIQEYDQRNSDMGENRGSQGSQDGRGKTSSTVVRYMFVDIRVKLTQS